MSWVLGTVERVVVGSIYLLSATDTAVSARVHVAANFTDTIRDVHIRTATVWRGSD